MPLQWNALKCHLCPCHVVRTQKSINCQILLHPIPCPVALSHKKRGRPTQDALCNSDLFSAVSVPRAQPAPEQPKRKQCQNHTAPPLRTQNSCSRRSTRSGAPTVCALCSYSSMPCRRSPGIPRYPVQMVTP